MPPENFGCGAFSEPEGGLLDRSDAVLSHLDCWSCHGHVRSGRHVSGPRCAGKNPAGSGNTEPADSTANQRTITARLERVAEVGPRMAASRRYRGCGDAENSSWSDRSNEGQSRKDA